MSRPETATVTRARHELLGRLGLPAGTPDEGLEESHRQLEEFLASAPEGLRGWADKRQSEADRIFDLLSGPESELADLVAARQAAVAPPRRDFPAWAKGLVGVVAVAAVVFGVYQIGRPPSAPPAMTAAPSAAPASAVALDEAAATELRRKLEADPTDVATLFDLGNVYYQADQFQQAAEWYQKVLDVDATNEKALVALGATSFNLGDLAKAETLWDQAAELYPNNPEVFYDLGFLYMTTNRMPEMKTAWDKVVAMAPDSTFAKAVQSQVGAAR